MDNANSHDKVETGHNRSLKADRHYKPENNTITRHNRTKLIDIKNEDNTNAKHNRTKLIDMTKPRTTQKQDERHGKTRRMI